MCTVTYRRDGESLLVAMNRDERWGRLPEEPPRTGGSDPSWIAPFDSEKGGTWIGVNDRGTVACLLNAYVPGDLELFGREGVPSRGGIVTTVLETEPDQLRTWVRDGLEADRYPSFTVLIWSPAGDLKVEWRLDAGLSCMSLESGQWGMATSSAWRTVDVLAWRAERFDEWQQAGAPSVGWLPSFNLLVEPGMEQWSPFATRSFSATRSVTMIEVNREPGRASLRWWPRPGRDMIPREPACRLELEMAEECRP